MKDDFYVSRGLLSESVDELKISLRKFKKHVILWTLASYLFLAIFMAVMFAKSLHWY